jgi:hypothetical protein
MTLDPIAITFRLSGLLDSLDNYKNSEKELLSIIKVFKELNKEKTGIKDSDALKKMNIDKILISVQEKINNSGNKKLIENLQKNSRI